MNCFVTDAWIALSQTSVLVRLCPTMPYAKCSAQYAFYAWFMTCKALQSPPSRHLDFFAVHKKGFQCLDNVSLKSALARERKRGIGKHSTLRISLPSSWSSSPTWVTEKSTIVIFALSSGEKCGLGKRVVQYSLKPSVKVTYRIKKISEGSVYLADFSMGHALACIRVE